MVLKKLLSLNSRAPGPDNLHLVKSCVLSLYKPVFLIIQQSLTTGPGKLPNFWKSANVIHVFKKGNKL